MKTILREPISYVIAYLFMIIFTFGHAYNNYPKEEPWQFAGQTYTIHNGPGTITFAAAACSIAWPLYWSVQFWS